MPTSIEQRVVQMRFDNKQFESGVAQSMSTLEKFEQKLKLKDASKGFDDLSRAASSVSLSGLTDQADSVSVKFDAMAVVAISALNRITNAAITAGTNLVKSLSVDQVSAGFSKYEARTAAVQTLVNATGRSVEDIEKYMSKLMTYSDETSYGFAEMSQALSTMVASGGDLDKLVPLLEGFGNATSFVGKGSNEFALAVRQLSQAYGRNKMMLEDWNPIQGQLGGAKQLRDVFIEVGEELGKIQKGSVTSGTFTDSLSKGWLDQSVMEEALGRFAEMTERAFEMIEAGEVETVSEAYEVLSQTVDDYRIKAAKAAQEAKSFTEAIDATKDAVSTKWMESFQIIFGNYEEATRLWTELTNTLYELFAASGDVRNEMLRFWKNFGGREVMILAVKAAFEALAKPLGAIGEAFKLIFLPPNTYAEGWWLYKVTVQIHKFWESLIMSDEAAEGLKTVVMALLLPVKALTQVIKVGFAVFANLIKIIFKLGEALLTLPTKIGQVENPLRKLFGDERYTRLIEALSTIVDKLGSAFSSVGAKIRDTTKIMTGFLSSKMQGSIAKLTEALTPIAEWILDRIVDGFELLAGFDYNRITDWAISAIDSLVTGFAMIGYGCTIAIGAIKDFFASFEGMTALEVIDSIIKGVASLKTNMMTFIKSLGFDQIMNALKTEASGVADVIGNLGEAVQTLVARLTPGKILIFSFGASLVWVFTNLAVAIAAFKKIAEGVVGVLGGITGVLKAFQQKLKGSPILQIAVAIGVLAISLGALAQIDSDKLKASAIALGSLMVVLGALVAGMAVITKFLITSDKMAKNLEKVTLSMIAMAASVTVLAGALFLLSKVDMEGMVPKLVMLTVIMGVLGAASIAVAKLAPELSKGAAFLLFFALSIGTIVSSLDTLASMNLESVSENVGLLVLIMTMLAGLSVASNKVNFGSAAGLTLFIIDLWLFVKVLQKLNTVDIGSLTNGIAMFIAMFASIIPLAIMAKAAGKEMTGASTLILGISAAMIIMSYAIESIGSLNLATVAKGTGAILAIMAMFAVLIELSQVAEKGSKIASPAFLAMSAAILILGVAINYIGTLELKAVVQGGIVVGALLGLFALIIKVAGEAKKATGMIIAMTVVIGLITAAIAILSLLTVEEAATATGALTAAFLGIAVMFKAAEKLNPTAAASTLIIAIAAILSVESIIRALSGLDPESVLPIAASIGILLVSIGASFALLQQNKIFETAVWDRIGRTLVMMLGMLALSGGVIWAISHLVEDPTDIIAKAAAVGIILLTLGKSMSEFNVKTALFKNMMKMVGVMFSMTVIAGAAIALLPSEDPAILISKAVGLSTLLLAISGAMSVLALVAEGLKTVGSSAPQVLAGAGALTVILGVLGAIIVGVGALFNSDVFGDLDSALTKAEDVIPRIGLVIGEFFGSIVAGVIGTSVIGILGALGLALSTFAENVQGFLGMRVEQGFLDSVVRLAEAVLIITAASFVQGLIPFASGNALVSFGIQLAAFGPYFAEFANSIAGIPIGPVNAASRCIASLAELMSAIPIEGGLWGIIFGEKGSLESFGSGLSTLAQGIVDYAGILSNADIDDSSIEKSNKIATMLVDLANKLPTTGGWVTEFASKDLGDFGGQLELFADGLAHFIEKINPIEYDDTKAKNIIKCSDMLIELAKKLPTTEGLVTHLAKQDIGQFGEQLVTFADKMGEFISSLNGFDDIDQGKFDIVIACANTLVELAKSVPKTGALISFFGGNDIGKFGEDIGLFGDGMATFFRTLAVSGFNENTIELSKKAGLAFVEISDALGTNDGLAAVWENTSLDKFGKEIGKLGEGIFNFYDKTSSVVWPDVSLAVTQLERLVTMAPSMAEINGGLAAGFSNYLKTLADSGITQFTESFSSAEEDISNTVYNTISSALATARTSMMATPSDYSFIADAIISGLTRSETDLIMKAYSLIQALKTAVYSQSEEVSQIGTFIILGITRAFENGSTALSEAVKRVMQTAIRAAKDSLRVTGTLSMEFQLIGKYTIDGYINGLSSNTGRLYNKLKEIGEQTVSTFEDAVGVASPSVKFAEIGMYSILGFVKGIDDNADKTKKSMIKMGENLLKSIQDFFGIHSPSTVMRDEVGRYIIDGIADGITTTTSAEEAASKKAQNIINAFKTEFDKWSLDTTTADLEFQLWEALNPNASDDEYTIKQAELLDKKLAYQAERVNNANAQYKATLEMLGANAKETQEAYNTYLQEQITLAGLAADLIDLQTNGVSGSDDGSYTGMLLSTMDSEVRSTRKAIDLYGDIMMSIRDSMLEQGFTLEEIEEVARRESGFVPKGTASVENAVSDVSTLMDQYLSKASGTIDGIAGQIEVVIPQSIGNTVQAAEPIASSAGQSIGATYSSGIGQGILSNSNAVTSSVEQILSNPLSSITSLYESDGLNAAQGLLKGWGDKMPEVGNGFVRGIEWIGKKVTDKLEEKSPSKVYERYGMYMSEGLAIGIDEAIPLAADSAISLVDSTIKALEPAKNEWLSIGKQMSSGLANGISANSSMVYNAVSTMINRTLSMTYSSLAIHSPSREYYEVGQMMDQGLANGIIDGTSIVTNAVSQMLTGVQGTINSTGLTISPVIEDGGSSRRGKLVYGGMGNWGGKVTDYTQFLQWDAHGNLIPVGYTNSGNKENARWWIASSREEAEYIRSLAERAEEIAANEEARRYYEQANRGIFEGTLEEFKELANAITARPPELNFTQNNYSPEALSGSQIYRNTETALSKVSEAVSPTGRSLKVGVSGTGSNKVSVSYKKSGS